MAKLLVHETAGIREFDIVDSEVRIGRELDNTLRLADPSISRHHAVLRRVAQGYEIQDLHSSNGVIINGNRLPLILLRDMDRITLGQVHLTFSDPEPSSAMPTSGTSASASPTSAIETQGFPKAEALSQASKAEGLQGNGIHPTEAMPKTYQESTGRILQKVPATSHDKGPVRSPAHKNPAPGLLRPWLPPIPDMARPTGERADFLTRLIAFMLDSLPFVILPTAFFALGFLLPKVKALMAFIVGMGFIFLLLGVAAYAAFLMWCWRNFGASPGKKLMKLRIVPEDDPDGHIDTYTAMLRVAGHVINGMFLMLPYLMIFRGDRRGIQDILSKSIVIKVDR